jgi:glycosyltransferase involved in cell wall biosynthesis
MRIAILAHGCRSGGGLSRGLNVVSCLRRVAPDHEYLLVFPAGYGFERLELPPTREVVYFQPSMGFVGRCVYDLYRLPAIVRRFHPDVVFGLTGIALRNPGGRQAFVFPRVVSLYPRKYSRGRTLANRLYDAIYMIGLRRGLRATQLVFCQTTAARKRFAETTGFRGRIEIMPNAVSEATTADSAEDPTVSFHLRDGEFVLFCLAQYYPHKNLESIVDMFERFRGRLQGVKCLLTIHRDQHTNAARLLRRIDKLGLQDQIINVGPLKQEQLGAYFREADALLLPTFLESFSQTYLESMHFGMPILTSDLDFAHAICGDAALYFDPLNIEDICRAVECVRDDPALRTELIARGHRRRASFVRSWESIVAEAMQAVTSLVQS